MYVHCCHLAYMLHMMCHSFSLQAVLFCHDKVSTKDLYISDANFHQATQDPEEAILSGSVCNLYLHSKPIDTSVPLSRDVPNSRKEDATIVFVTRTHRPLVSILVACLYHSHNFCASLHLYLPGQYILHSNINVLFESGLPVIPAVD